MRDADYIYAVACIRAKEKTLLNVEYYTLVYGGNDY